MSNNQKYYQIYNILKRLGFRSHLYGTKLLIKAILIVSTQSDHYNIKDIYSAISLSLKKENKNISPEEVKSLIYYSINNRKKIFPKRILKISSGLNMMNITLQLKS